MRLIPSYLNKIVVAGLLLFVMASCSGKSGAVISGRIDGGNESMPRADIHVNLLGHADTKQAVQSESDGTFHFKVKTPGIYHLLVSGVNHRPFEMMLDLNHLSDLSFNIHLSPELAPADTASLNVIGSFNHFSTVTGVAMKRQKDGTFKAEITNDSSAISYQIIGLNVENPVNGTESDHYVYDGNGEYVSVLQTNSHEVTITLDPHKLASADDSAFVTFTQAPHTVTEFNGIYHSMVLAQKEYWASVRSQLQNGKSLNNVTYNWKPYRTSVEKKLEMGQSGDIQRLELLSYLSIGMYDASQVKRVYARTALQLLSPDDELWSVQPLTMLVAVDLSGNRTKYQSYIDQAENTHSDPNVKATLLYYQLTNAVHSQNLKQAQQYYKLLLTEYGNTVYAQWAQQEFSMTQQVAVGKPVPDFKVASLTNPSVTYSNNSMLGKYYLIDFWATWCGPCLGEMPYLQKAYNKYKGKDFQILSLSLDDSPGDVQKFRHEKYPMPWLHAFLKGGFQNPLAEEFGVNAIPNPVLVNNKGIVVAKGVDLRGPYLDETLSKYLR